MKTFEGFIESDAFFPILIILLIILIAVFVWIVISNKQEEKKQRAQKQLLIDESAEIKIIDNNHQRVELKSMDELINTGNYEDDDEPERNEIAIIQEVSSTKSSDNQNNKANDKKVEEASLEKEEDEFKKVDVPNDEENQDESIKVPGLFKEEVADIENINVHLNPEDNVEKSEVELPMAKEDLEDETEEEEIEPEMTEEEKAIEEAFALPDFDDISDENLEGEIIEAANKYIAEIMKKEDN